MKQNIQQLIIAATIILAAGNNWAVAQSNSTAISSSETISTSSPSPRLSLRSNLLLWGLCSPSLGMDLTLGRRWQVGLDGSYGNWSLSHRTHAARLSTAGLQLRRYFRPFTNRNSASHPSLDIYISSSRGAYLGIDLRYTHFNEQLLTAGTPGDARATSYQPESSLDTPSHLTPAAAGPLTPHLPWDISTKTTTDTPGTPPPPKTGYSVPAPTTASH